MLEEAESRWSAQAMNPETWLEEVQLSSLIKKKINSIFIASKIESNSAFTA